MEHSAEKLTNPRAPGLAWFLKIGRGWSLPNHLSPMKTVLALALPTLALILSSTATIAQTQPRLIGITRQLPSLRQHDHANCQLVGQCALPGMPNAAVLPGYAGGTGWDPVRSGAWVSNGLVLAKYNDQCQLQCPPMPIPSLGANAVITGIEVVVGLNQVWLIDSTGILHRYTNTCPPMPLGTCNTGLGQTALGNVTTGLAVDEGAGFVFISYPQFPIGANQIAVMPMPAICQVTQTFPTPPCFAVGMGPILGLACDWGNQRLYATDGANSVAINYMPGAAAVAILGANCCPAVAVVDRMIGLAIRPGGATSAGQPCANGPCMPCPMAHTLRNDPLLGNAQFQLGLDSAQPNVFAFCLIGSGPCMNIGIVTPPLCGPILTVPYLGNLGPNITAGTPAPCSGTTSFTLPLPVVPALAGQIFSSQCLTVCFSTTGAFGTSLSNCLSWQLQGN